MRHLLDTPTTTGWSNKHSPYSAGRGQWCGQGKRKKTNLLPTPSPSANCTQLGSCHKKNKKNNITTCLTHSACSSSTLLDSLSCCVRVLHPTEPSASRRHRPVSPPHPPSRRRRRPRLRRCRLRLRRLRSPSVQPPPPASAWYFLASQASVDTALSSSGRLRITAITQLTTTHTRRVSIRSIYIFPANSPLVSASPPSTDNLSGSTAFSSRSSAVAPVEANRTDQPYCIAPALQARKEPR